MASLKLTTVFGEAGNGSVERSRPRPLMLIYIYRCLIMGTAERLLSGRPVVTTLVHSSIISPSLHGTLYLMATEIYSNQCSTVSNLEAHGLQLRTFSPTPSQRASSRYLFNATAHKLNVSRIQLFFMYMRIRRHSKSVMMYSPAPLGGWHGHGVVQR